MSKRSLPHILFRTQKHGRKHAIVTESNTTTFHQLQWGAQRIAKHLTTTDLKEERIAFLSTPNESYTMNQWGVWAAGGIAVPLHCHHPRKEWEYVLEDAQVSGIVCDSSTESAALLDSAKALSIPVLNPPTTKSISTSEMHDDDAPMPQWNASNFDPERGAQILYTSGTTGRPKGVVMSHGNLQQQIHDIVNAWEMTSNDRLLHFLPLHHTHGIMNNLLCPLFAGATVEMLPRADPRTIWEKYSNAATPLSENNYYTMMMAVPTIYMKLLEEVELMSEDQRQTALEVARKLRVTISGSAACPIRIMDEWEKLTGHRLLERYGMTELGMALTNPLHGERVPGYVGRPFPSVQVRVVDSETQEEETKGELRVKGPGIFREYWNRPEETSKEFDEQGWFKTGDVAEYSEKHQSFRILGRASVDILKSGGYKISALEIEAAILEHQGVAECYVLGLEDETWGEIIVAIVRLRKNSNLANVQAHTKQNLASYKVPRRWIEMEDIPKNAMGKVNKKQLRSSVQEMKSGNSQND